MTVIMFYALIEVLNILILFALIGKKEYQNGVNILFVIALIVRGYGQFALASAKTLEMALYANEMVYFGGIFLPMTMYFVAAKICRVEIPKPQKVIMIGYSAIVFHFVLTIGRSEIYYKSVDILIHPEGYATLVKEYGPAHILYSVMLIVYFALFIVLLIMTMKRREETSKTVIIEVWTLTAGVYIMYLVNRLISSPVNLTSISYLLVALFTLKIVNDAELRDVPSCIADIGLNDKKSAFVVFDSKLHFVNSNELARSVFPEISDLTPDAPVKEDNSFFSQVVMGIVKKYNQKPEKMGEEQIVPKGDKRYLLTFNHIMIKTNVSAGIFLKIQDVTTRERLAEVQAKYRIDLQQQVRHKERDLFKMQNQMILGLTTLVESRDDSAGLHIERTMKVMEAFSARIKKEIPDVDKTLVDFVYRTTPMHDLGKISVSDTILKSTEELTGEQQMEYRSHTVEGGRIVVNILKGVTSDKMLEAVSNLAVYHHERWDGTGYPEGLKGEEIPLEGRIMAIVDAFDNMFSKKRKIAYANFDEVMKAFSLERGKGFDPKLFDVFMRCEKEIRKVYKDYVYSE